MLFGLITVLDSAHTNFQLKLNEAVVNAYKNGKKSVLDQQVKHVNKHLLPCVNYVIVMYSKYLL